MDLVLGAEILRYHYNNKFDSYLDIDDIECIEQIIRPGSGVYAGAAAYYEHKDFIHPSRTVNLGIHGSSPDCVQDMTAAVHVTGATAGASHKHKHAHKVPKECIPIEIFIDKICDIMNHPTLKIFIYYQHEHNHNQIVFFANGLSVTIASVIESTKCEKFRAVRMSKVKV